MSGSAAGTVVTVGSFDGVHRGHLAVLEEIAGRALATGRRSVLVTFEPHPMEVINPAVAPLRLTTPVERLEVLAQTRLDSVAILRFDGRLRAMDPEAFVREILLERFAVRELVIGEDHGFGRGRAGDVAVLRHLGRVLGFTVDVVAPVQDVDGGAISSTRVRHALAAGELEAVGRMLGRRYSLTAAVEHGAGRGRTIGVPTANLRVSPRKQLPPDGVYAVRVEWAGGRADGMLNQGSRPTVGDPGRSVEVHLFDVAPDLYGRVIRVEWVARLRDIRRFESLDALGRQLAEDRRLAKARLAAE